MIRGHNSLLDYRSERGSNNKRPRFLANQFSHVFIHDVLNLAACVAIEKGVV